MTMTSIEDLSALDWDPEIPCENPRCPAGQPPATWWAQFVCKCTFLICDTCAEHQREEAERQPDKVGPIVTGCGWTGIAHFRDVVTLKPLR